MIGTVDDVLHELERAYGEAPLPAMRARYVSALRATPVEILADAAARWMRRQPKRFPSIADFLGVIREEQTARARQEKAETPTLRMLETTLARQGNTYGRDAIAMTRWLLESHATPAAWVEAFRDFGATWPEHGGAWTQAADVLAREGLCAAPVHGRAGGTV